MGERRWGNLGSGWCPFLPQLDFITVIPSSFTFRLHKFDCNRAGNRTHHSLKSWKGSYQTERQHSSCSAVTITQHIFSQFILFWLTPPLHSRSNTRLTRTMAKSTTRFWMRKMCTWRKLFPWTKWNCSRWLQNFPSQQGNEHWNSCWMFSCGSVTSHSVRVKAFRSTGRVWRVRGPLGDNTVT